MSNFFFDPSTKFLDPERTLFAVGLAKGQHVADLGTGSGYYTLTSGKIVGEQGLVFAVDILEGSLDHVAAEGRLQGLKNIKLLHVDLEQNNSCAAIPTGSIDVVVLANILHQIKNKSNLFAEAYRIAKTGAKFLIIEWNDQPSPIGPPLSERIQSELVNKLAVQVTLKPAGSVVADIYHYGSLFIK